MRISLANCLVLLSVMALAACATVTPDHVALAPKVHDNLTSTEIVAPISQSEIYVYVPPSEIAQRGGGGLLLALVDAGVNNVRTAHAESAVKSLRDAVVDYDFDQTLKADLKESISQLDWMHVDGVRVVKATSSATLDQVVSSSKNAAVLTVAADYHLSNDGRELTVVLHANLYANSAALASSKPAGGKADSPADPSNALYRNTFTFNAWAPGAAGERDQNIAAWSANKGAPLRAALSFGAARLSRMVEADLQGQEDVAGAPVDSTMHGSVVRNGDGTLEFTASAGS